MGDDLSAKTFKEGIRGCPCRRGRRKSLADPGTRTRAVCESEVRCEPPPRGSSQVATPAVPVSPWVPMLPPEGSARVSWRGAAGPRAGQVSAATAARPSLPSPPTRPPCPARPRGAHLSPPLPRQRRPGLQRPWSRRRGNRKGMRMRFRGCSRPRRTGQARNSPPRPAARAGQQ